MTSSTAQTKWPLIFGALLLVCALIFYYFTVLRIDYARTPLLDLVPYTDAVEYFAQAEAMTQGGSPSIQIGFDKLPSRFPFGYPVLMVPWLKLLPASEAVLAPFRTNQAIGLLLLLAVFAAYLFRGLPLSGGFAVTLLSTLPAFISLSRSSLSDIPGAALVALSFMFVYFGLNDKKRWQIYLGAALLGAACVIRTQLFFFAPFLLAMALFPEKGSIAVWFGHCFGVLLVFAIAVSPVFLVNYAWFHNPFRTGYDFWVPGITHKFFSIHNIPKHIAMLWDETTARWQLFNEANIFGTGTHFVAPFVVLSFIGFVFLNMNRFTLCALLAAFSFLVSSATNIFAVCRYYLPILILMIPLAVLAVDWATRMLLARKQIPAACLIAGLFLLSCIGFPSQSGFKPVGGRSQAWDALHFSDRPHRSPRFLAQEWFIRLYGGQPGIVLSDIDPVYLNALWPEPFVAAPLDGKHRYCYSKIWHYDRAQALQVIERGLAKSLPVYALFVSQKEMNEQQSRLPVVSGYQWNVLATSRNGALLNLARNGFQEKAPP